MKTVIIYECEDCGFRTETSTEAKKHETSCPRRCPHETAEFVGWEVVYLEFPASCPKCNTCTAYTLEDLLRNPKLAKAALEAIKKEKENT